MATPERLADARIQSYLATKEVVTLATLGADGAPHAMAMWFLPTPDAILMLSVGNLEKVRQIRRDPRVAVAAESADADGGGIRGVTLRGRAAFLGDAAERAPLVEQFLARYHPRLERLWGGRAMPHDRVMFRIRPDHVRSWGLG